METDLPVDPNGMVLGWRDDVEDVDSLEAQSFLFAMDETFTAPRSMDPRKWLRVEDQGQIGSCSGNARTTVEELCLALQAGSHEGVEQLARMGAYLAAQKLDGLLGRDQGATIDGQAKAAKQYGTAPERFFRYPSAYTSHVPDEYWREAAKCKCGSTTVLRSADEMLAFLGRGIGGVVIGIPWTESMANSRGLVESVGGRTLGGHALAVVGYLAEADGGRNDRQGRPYPLVANSHTARWGNGGYGLFAPALFDRSDWVKIGFSDLPDPNGGVTQRNWWSGKYHPLA